MFEQRIRSIECEVTIYTLFGVARGDVVECFDGWFTFKVKHNNSVVSLYYEDVLMLEEHQL